MSRVKEKICTIAGESRQSQGLRAAPPTWTRSARSRILVAHGTAVGLNDGLMGKPEDIVRIDVSIKKREFHKNATICASCERAKAGNGRLHLLGLISDGGVHSYIHHLFALLETAKELGVPHFIADGRDTAPRSAAGYCQDLLDFLKKEEYGTLATVVGRYYAMDRDKRWERVKTAVDGLVGGEGAPGEAAVEAIKKCYEEDVTDEFLKPIIVNGDEGRIKDDDTLFFFNYRSDRMREIVTVFGLTDKPMEVTVPTGLHITTMSSYNPQYCGGSDLSLPPLAFVHGFAPNSPALVSTPCFKVLAIALAVEAAPSSGDRHEPTAPRRAVLHGALTATFPQPVFLDAAVAIVSQSPRSLSQDSPLSPRAQPVPAQNDHGNEHPAATVTFASTAARQFCRPLILAARETAENARAETRRLRRTSAPDLIRFGALFLLYTGCFPSLVFFAARRWATPPRWYTADANAE
ncbi:BPG-independent [Mycena pura]|uniref:phosphoglycerate mutase (2,3-diphosphoglycerate-independent) n=1 Tax=Mycena pura TaxID=153505 RepID=A0AAD6UW33_9AGAR|nr:BPG-independent [Mycena pura]